MNSAHKPVLLSEVLETLSPKSGEIMVDLTVGAGGHGIPIAERLAPGGTFIGIDWDGDRIDSLNDVMGQLALDLEKLLLVEANYADLPEILQEENISGVDGVLADLGFSSDQLSAGRGFAFRGEEEPLAMTYNKQALPVRELLKQLSERELAEIIRDLSDERYAKRIAGAIVERRREKPIQTNKDLADIVRKAVPAKYEGGRIDAATRTFMALRIYANREIENLGRLLGTLTQVVRPGGRAAIISYHSKEDGMVKEYFRELAREGKVQLLTPKPIRSSAAEVAENPRSRSAKLRAIKIN